MKKITCEFPSAASLNEELLAYLRPEAVFPLINQGASLTNTYTPWYSARPAGSTVTYLSVTLMQVITIHHSDWLNTTLLWPAGAAVGRRASTLEGLLFTRQSTHAHKTPLFIQLTRRQNKQKQRGKTFRFMATSAASMLRSCFNISQAWTTWSFS